MSLSCSLIADIKQGTRETRGLRGRSGINLFQLIPQTPINHRMFLDELIDFWLPAITMTKKGHPHHLGLDGCQRNLINICHSDPSPIFPETFFWGGHKSVWETNDSSEGRSFVCLPQRQLVVEQNQFFLSLYAGEFVPMSFFCLSIWVRERRCLHLCLCGWVYFT